MASRSLNRAGYMAVYQVPVNELVDDPFCAHGVIFGDVIDRLIGKDDSPTKRIIGLVALIHLDLVFGVAQFQADSEIETGGSTAKTNDFHDMFSIATQYQQYFTSKMFG